MVIHLSVEVSCWRQCLRRTFDRNSSRDGPLSGSLGRGNSPGRSARILYHELGTSSGSRTTWSLVFTRASCNDDRPSVWTPNRELSLQGSAVTNAHNGQPGSKVFFPDQERETEHVDHDQGIRSR